MFINWTTEYCYKVYQTCDAVISFWFKANNVSQEGGYSNPVPIQDEGAMFQRKIQDASLLTTSNKRLHSYEQVSAGSPELIEVFSY